MNYLLEGSVGASTSVLFKKGLGSLVYDMDGREYIDAQAQAWSLALGHCHPEILEAIQVQASLFTHLRTGYGTVNKNLLAEKLSHLFFNGKGKVAFALSGSDCVEGALKLAFRNSKSQTVVSCWNGYHGRTFSTMKISWPHIDNPFSEWGGPVVRIMNPYCYRCVLQLEEHNCQYACVNLVKETINKNCSVPPACIILEPIQGNGGMIPFPIEWLKRIHQLAKSLGTLVIFDEIQTSMGRCGDWSISKMFDITPSILVIGKGLGGGLPLFASISDVPKSLEPGDHSFTFAHFPLAIATALTTINILERDNIFLYVKKWGKIVKDRLKEFEKRYEIIGDVRGTGFMLGVELVMDRKLKTPATEATSFFVKEALDRGLLIGSSQYAGLGNVIKFKPALNIPEDLINRALRIFEQCLQVTQEKFLRKKYGQ